jgi:hypothetical protein
LCSILQFDNSPGVAIAPVPAPARQCGPNAGVQDAKRWYQVRGRGAVEHQRHTLDRRAERLDQGEQPGRGGRY